MSQVSTKSKKKPVAERPFVRVEGQTLNQKKYIQDMCENDFTICIGPPGSGKSHIASGIGAEYLHDRAVKKLILTRPIVAAEDIGYLPGDSSDKIHPYLIPLFEELGYFINVESMIKSKQVFIEPVAFLRGRTIKNAFIIVDEAQNCTYNQLKMIMTRLGDGSKMVINGDITQSDLPYGKSGLEEIANRLKRAPYGVCTVRELGKEDIVRHPSVNEILKYIEGDDYATKA